MLVKSANILNPSLVDITGGAPEMNPYLKDFINELDRYGHPIQVRTNLTVLLEGRRGDFIKFYKDKCVKLVASLPCYEAEEVNSVRGEGTFEKSIESLKVLNTVGYGVEDKLELDLVFNPEDAFLPPNQKMLEETYKVRLKEDYGIVFNNLITITNMPVGRFEIKLRDEGNLNSYMKLLIDRFNPETLTGLMCRTQISVNYDGGLFDCDFNIARNKPVKGKPNIRDPNLDLNTLKVRNIVTDSHCYGCTAGEGSSCSGAIIS